MVASYPAEPQLPIDKSYHIRNEDEKYLLACLECGWHCVNCFNAVWLPKQPSCVCSVHSKNNLHVSECTPKTLFLVKIPLMFLQCRNKLNNPTLSYIAAVTDRLPVQF